MYDNGYFAHVSPVTGKGANQLAADTGYDVFGRGLSCAWRTTEEMAVYYVTLEDAGGRTRHAYVRCGGWLLGLFSRRVTVEWVD